ncbi:MAG TPA: cell envelope integrity protein CreD [Saprospiraceae bacterium]|nr:cell envelope integrity protein CreD [Saprospiraceae bacterium]
METTQSNPEPNFFQRNQITMKGALIFLLMLALLIPTSMVESLIVERESRKNEAFQEVSSKWGGQQTIVGPVLVVPYENTVYPTDGDKVRTVTEYAYFLPDDLNISSQVSPEKRYRGIFEVVLYGSKVQLDGVFNPLEVQKLIPENAPIFWDKAVLVLGIPDLRGLDDQVKLNWNDQELVFEPGVPAPDLTNSGIHVPLSIKPDARHPFRIELELKGSDYLFFTPVGKMTKVKMSAPWKDPSFTGAFLPDEKNITAEGFDATWKVLNLNRNFPQQWVGNQAYSFQESAFGVSFLLPVDNYQKSTRSVKYAILFIGLTFLTIFFIELGQKKRVHPFQYALIGLALVIFYTLLVSISEHTSFNLAYLIAGTMTVGLASIFARSLFQSGKMALVVGGTMTLLYGFLFVVLQLQDYALLIGSLGLFAILAVVMYVSRRVLE